MTHQKPRPDILALHASAASLRVWLLAMAVMLAIFGGRLPRWLDILAREALHEAAIDLKLIVLALAMARSPLILATRVRRIRPIAVPAGCRRARRHGSALRKLTRGMAPPACRTPVLGVRFGSVGGLLLSLRATLQHFERAIGRVMKALMRGNRRALVLVAPTAPLTCASQHTRVTGVDTS